MFSWRFRAVIVIAGASSFCCLTVGRADEAAFREHRPAIQLQLHSKNPAERVAGLQKLQEHAIVEAVKLIVQSGFQDPVPAVRLAAFETLLSYKQNQDVCDFLLGMLKQGARCKSPSDACPPALAVLLSSPLPKVHQAARDFVDNTLSTSDGGIILLTTMADELGSRKNVADLVPLGKLSRSKIFAREFSVRRAVIHAMAHIEQPELIDALIGLLPGLQGEVQADVAAYLSEVTGQAWGLDAQAWTKWWSANKTSFQFPANVVHSPIRLIPGVDSTSYYGLPIYAQRLVFVMDTSGSMSGPKLEAAKRELTAGIQGLRETCYFSVVVFNSQVALWQRRLMLAEPTAKRDAILFVNRQIAQSSTASYDALEAAFGFDAEAIYFLTDGAPSSGKFVAPVDIVSVITRGNRIRRELIYTIGIGVGLPGDLFDTFLRTLAEQNLGVYRRVDQ